MVSKNQQKIREANGMPSLPTWPTQVRLREMWVLWTLLGQPIDSHLALGGRVFHSEGREWSQKIGKK